jgi:glycerophosphoryl diester phosphodiesterase
LNSPLLLSSRLTPKELRLMRYRPLLIGHRGARGQGSIRENTIAAFDFALAQGCDGFEFDVRLSADGKAVISHDAKLRNSQIATSTAEELHLPLLSEVLALYRRRGFLDIELKVSGLERITSELLREFPPSRGFVVSSFLPEVLENLHGLYPKVPLGLICETRSQLEFWRRLQVEYVIPHYKLVKPNFVKEVKSAKKKILIWTVNLPTDMKRFSQMGVNGIISDDPKKLLVALRGVKN